MQKNKIVKENIVYIKESEARAIGIYETGKQSVYIDGKLVDVLFVDEHDVLPASVEEKKIYAEGSKIRQRREAERLAEKKEAEQKASKNNIEARDLVVTKKTSDAKIEKEKKAKSGFFKSLFGRKQSNGIQNSEIIKNEKSSKTQGKQPKNVVITKAHKSKVKSDIFTAEELEIIEGIISKTKKTSKSNTKKTKK